MTYNKRDGIFNTLKRCAGGNILINTLLMPILMGDPGEIDVKEALERVSVADVEKWKRKTFGVTFFQEKRAKTRKLRPENPQEVIL